MKVLRILVPLFFIIITNTVVFANKKVVLTDKDEVENIGKKVGVYEDKKGVLSINDIVDINEFYYEDLDAPNLGITNSVFWLKVELINQSDVNDFVLGIGQPTIDEVHIYRPDDNGNYTNVFKTGENYPFSHREYEIQNYLFDVKMKHGESKTIYLRLHSTEQLLPLIFIGSQRTVLENNHLNDLIFGLYIGLIAAMFLYNLFIYFTVKDKIYLLYVVYIFFIGITQSAILGYPFQYLWPESTWFAKQSVNLFSVCVSISALEFMKVFLQTKKYAPTVHKVSYFFTALYLLTALLSLLGVYLLAYYFVLINAALISVFMLYSAVILLQKGYKPAKFFLLAWTGLLAGIIFYVLKDFGILPNSLFTRYMMPAGSALEAVLLSFALADRINILKKEKEESQTEALKMAQENERIIKEQNILLEQRVTERTVELQQSNEELNATLENLKDTQAQLVDSEKMASLGQLTAGIAHEINNPINFVTSNITPLKHDISDIMELLDKYGEIKEPGELERQLKEVEDLKEEIDLEYVKEEIESLLKGIQEGAERTSEIVRGLKNFSRLDEDDLKKADLNEGIDSTLTLLNNKLKDNISVEKKYAISSKVDCYPGKINQLLMNIINNAIHAIEANDTLKPSEGLLTIATEEYEKEVMIKVSDNGVGMDEQTKKKMFDPFYTTKEVGKGTGLGMSIVYKIIQNHKGRIEIESVLGEGTSVIIYLPKVV